MAPRPLIAALSKLPATVILFPDCTECSVQTPSDLVGHRFNRRVDVVIQGTKQAGANTVVSLEKNVVVTYIPSRLDSWFDPVSAARVIGISAEGRLAYIQASYLPIKDLEELIDGL
jgi:hypothetical protein